MHWSCIWMEVMEDLSSPMWADSPWLYPGALR